MLDEGVYLAPSAYEAGFTSIAHDNEVVAAIITAADAHFKRLKFKPDVRLELGSNEAIKQAVIGGFEVFIFG